MNTIEIVDPGWNWSLMLLWLFPGVVVLITALAMALLSNLASTRSLVRRWRSIASNTAFAGLISVVLLLFAGAVHGIYLYGDALAAAQKEALVEAGYPVSKVLSGDKSNGYVFLSGEPGDETAGATLLYHLEGNLWGVVGGKS